MNVDEQAKKSRRGFAAMDPKIAREISRKGGKAAHVAGTAHEFTSEEAKIAGRKGGAASARRRIRKDEVGRCSCGAIFFTTEAAGEHECAMPATERAPAAAEHAS